MKALQALRPTEEQRCPVCRSPVDTGYLVCPVCTTRLRESCSGCKAPLDPLWQVCPFCETPVSRPQPVVELPDAGSDAAERSKARRQRRAAE